MPLPCALQGASEAEDEEVGHEVARSEHTEEGKAAEADQERLVSHSRAGSRQLPSGQTADNDVACNKHPYRPELWAAWLSHYRLHPVWLSTALKDARLFAGEVEVVTAGQEVPSIEETARLFVRNLSYSTTEADLAETFREHGEVSEAHLVLDRWPQATATAAGTHSSAPCITKHTQIIRCNCIVPGRHLRP